MSDIEKKLNFEPLKAPFPHISAAISDELSGPVYDAYL